SVPASLIARAVAGATSQSVAPPVLALTQGVLKTMLLKKLIVSTAVSILGVGTVLLTLGLAGGRPAAAQPDDKPKPAPVAKPQDKKPAGENPLLGGWKIIKVTANGREEIGKDAGPGPKSFFFTKGKGYMSDRDGLGASFEYIVDDSHKPAHI